MISCAHAGIFYFSEFSFGWTIALNLHSANIWSSWKHHLLTRWSLMFSVNTNVCDRKRRATQVHYLRAARYNIASQLQCSPNVEEKRNQSKDGGGGGDLLTGQWEVIVCSLSLHQLWRNPNWQRRLRTTENIHLLLCLIFPSPSLPNWNEHNILARWY